MTKDKLRVTGRLQLHIDRDILGMLRYYHSLDISKKGYTETLSVYIERILRGWVNGRIMEDKEAKLLKSKMEYMRNNFGDEDF